MPCQRCDTVRSSFPTEGRLYLWFPTSHPKSLPRPHWVTDGCVVMPFRGDAAQCVRDVCALLSSEERRDTRALLVAGHGSPALRDLRAMRSLDDLLRLGEGEWLVEMLAENRLTSHFHAIVDAQDTSRIYAHEALLRGVDRDGGLVQAAAIFETARSAELLFQLDLAARRTAIRTAAEQGACSLFVNFSPASIYDPATCLRSTVALVEELGLAKEQLVFEVIEADRVADLGHLKNVLEQYRREGFRVALDDLGAGWSTLNLVHQLRPDFIKLDRELIRGISADPVRAVIASKLVEMARELGISTVVEGVETEGELRWARAAGADYVQGFLISRPEAAPVALTPRLAA